MLHNFPLRQKYSDEAKYYLLLFIFFAILRHMCGSYIMASAKACTRNNTILNHIALYGIN